MQNSRFLEAHHNLHTQRSERSCARRKVRKVDKVANPIWQAADAKLAFKIYFRFRNSRAAVLLVARSILVS